MKAVITVVGKDRVGIIHDVSKILCENNINILDISQTIMNEYFTMIMLTDLSKATNSLSQVKDLLEVVGVEKFLNIIVQHEDIFNAIHRL